MTLRVSMPRNRNLAFLVHLLRDAVAALGGGLLGWLIALAALALPLGLDRPVALAVGIVGGALVGLGAYLAQHVVRQTIYRENFRLGRA